jgi:hypothetical protein
MVTEAQADTMIALLVEIRDELQRPRLAREEADRRMNEQLLKNHGLLEAAHAADAAERAEKAKTSLWAGGAGIISVREGGPKP